MKKKLNNKFEKELIEKDKIQRIINNYFMTKFYKFKNRIIESKSIFQSNNNLNNSSALDPYYNLPEKSQIIQTVNTENNFNNNQNNLIEENYSKSFQNNNENNKIECSITVKIVKKIESNSEIQNDKENIKIENNYPNI